MSLRPGEGRRVPLAVPLREVELAGERYLPESAAADGSLEVCRMAGLGHALRLSFDAALTGPCMRCLKDARHALTVEAREVDIPGEVDDLNSPYVERTSIDLASWAHDALVLALPVKILCREDCLGLCPICAADLNEVGEGHGHDPLADPRWAKLRELKLE